GSAGRTFRRTPCPPTPGPDQKRRRLTADEPAPSAQRLPPPLPAGHEDASKPSPPRPRRSDHKADQRLPARLGQAASAPRGGFRSAPTTRPPLPTRATIYQQGASIRSGRVDPHELARRLRPARSARHSNRREPSPSAQTSTDGGLKASFLSLTNTHKRPQPSQKTASNGGIACRDTPATGKTAAPERALRAPA